MRGANGLINNRKNDQGRDNSLKFGSAKNYQILCINTIEPILASPTQSIEIISFYRFAIRCFNDVFVQGFGQIRRLDGKLVRWFFLDNKEKT